MTAFEHRLMLPQTHEESDAVDADVLRTAAQKYDILFRGYFGKDTLSALNEYYDFCDNHFLSLYHAVPEEDKQSYTPEVDDLLASIKSKFFAVAESIPSESGEYWGYGKAGGGRPKPQSIIQSYQICAKAFLNLRICEAEFYDLFLLFSCG